MGRRRDHHPRFDASLCPDPAACGRLLHPSLVATGMESCECCGANLEAQTLADELNAAIR